MPVFLTLGDVTFQNFEIPGAINFGGEQMLSVKKLVGGERIIDAMGRDDSDISWNALFQGSTANFRAAYLDGLRVKGKPLPLTWSQYNFIVLIKKFEPVFIRYYWLEYSITCTVIQDLNKPFPLLLPVAYDDAIQNALTEANDLAAVIANPSIISSLAILSESINAVASIENATASTITTITGPLDSAINVTSEQISELSAGIF